MNVAKISKYLLSDMHDPVKLRVVIVLLMNMYDEATQCSDVEFAEEYEKTVRWVRSKGKDLEAK